MSQARKTAPASGLRADGGTGPRRELVERLLLDVAARLFDERGFAGTSLQDVADEMGVTRSAIYYYVSNKEDILARLVEEFPTRDSERLRAIRRRRGVGPQDALREMVRAHVTHVAERPGWLRMLDRNEHHLSGALADTHAKAKRMVLSEIKSVIDAGVDAGAFRAVDTRTAALAIIGMSNWVSWWHEPDRGPSAEVVAEQIADMAVRTVAIAPDAADPTQPPTPHDVLSGMQADIARLKRMLPD